MARKNEYLLGVILIIIGGVFFLRELGIFVNFSFRYIWPIALILFGASLIFNNKKY